MIEAGTAPENTAPENTAPENTAPYRRDDIKTEYHPFSNIPTKIEHFEDYKVHTEIPSSTPHNDEPWRPFRSRIDFEFAEIVLAAAIKEDHANSLIRLIHHNANEKGLFTLKNYADIQDMWVKASAKLTAVSFHVFFNLLRQTSFTAIKFNMEKVIVPYKKETYEYNMFFRPLWDWATDLLSDPQFAPLFVWDAQRLSKYNGTSFVRFYHEPWTANRMWEIQV